MNHPTATQVDQPRCWVAGCHRHHQRDGYCQPHRRERVWRAWVAAWQDGQDTPWSQFAALHGV